MQSVRLEFSHIGRRTQLVRRRFSWPFHVGRQFHEPDAPGAAVVVLQSASGTLNTGDHLSVTLVLNDRAVARVRGQGAPSVHRARDGRGVMEETAITVGHDAYLEHLPEPRVLFPGARFSQVTTVELVGAGRALLTDGVIALQGESGQGFDAYAGELVVRRDSELLVHEQVRTGDWSRAPGRIRSFTAFGQILLLAGPGERLPDFEREWSDRSRYLSSAALPNRAGLLVRVAAIGGRQLRDSIDEVVTRCRATGTMPVHGAATTQS
jgi:urease accessory protein